MHKLQQQNIPFTTMFASPHAGWFFSLIGAMLQARKVEKSLNFFPQQTKNEVSQQFW